MRRVLRKIAQNDHDLGDTSTVADPSVISQLFSHRCLTTQWTRLPFTQESPYLALQSFAHLPCPHPGVLRARADPHSPSSSYLGPRISFAPGWKQLRDCQADGTGPRLSSGCSAHKEPLETWTETWRSCPQIKLSVQRASKGLNWSREAAL